MEGMKIYCPFCDKGELIPGSFPEYASLSCSKCPVIISFGISLEEVMEKIKNKEKSLTIFKKV